MFRFVLLAHDWPAPHLDLFLETGEALVGWRLPPGPVSLPVAVEPMPPHRKLYLDYEGPVSGDRGEVRRVDAGPLEWAGERFRLAGAVLSGEFEVVPSGDGWVMRRTTG